jgi:enterochelin esterase family protein
VSETAHTEPSAPDAVLRVADPENRFRAVRLVADLFKREPPLPFRRRAAGEPWELPLALPAVDRLEYQLQVVTADDAVELVLDPDAPQASGPWGAKSVLELDAYRPPDWFVAGERERSGILEALELPSERLRATVHGLVWRPDGTEPDEPLPLLVAHDGPEYAEHSALAEHLAAIVAAGDAPPFRAALLEPLKRDEHYGASQRYSAALVEELVPALAPDRPPVGLGASLGALAFLHAHRLHPGAFGALFLQSGSFFQPSTDDWESGHPRFGPITRFVRRVLTARSADDPVPVVLTCGAAEENVANNRALRNALLRQGYEAELVLVRDAHNWVAWRDAFHPHLARLLTRLWG